MLETFFFDVYPAAFFVNDNDAFAFWKDFSDAAYPYAEPFRYTAYGFFCFRFGRKKQSFVSFERGIFSNSTTAPTLLSSVMCLRSLMSPSLMSVIAEARRFCVAQG